LTQAAKTGVTVNFVYDPFHRNIRKDDGTNKTRYIYAGDQILCEYNDTSGALQNRYVYGFEADDPIIQVTSGGTITYNTQDHVGSIIARTNTSGGILSKYKYAPFGESPSLTGTIFGFTGQRFDVETGLYHFKARYYDPVTGRFLQPDSIGYGDGLNLYRYAENSPLGHTDPSGTESFEVKMKSELVNATLDLIPIVGDIKAVADNIDYLSKPHSHLENLGMAAAFRSRAIIKAGGTVGREAWEHARDLIQRAKNFTDRSGILDRIGAKGRRAQDKYATVPGKDVDHALPVVLKPLGSNRKRAINRRDNRSSGSSIGKQLKGIPNGVIVELRVE